MSSLVVAVTRLVGAGIFFVFARVIRLGLLIPILVLVGLAAVSALPESATWSHQLVQQLPSWLRPQLPPPPSMVKAPVAKHAIAAGERIDDLDMDIDEAMFVRSELKDKVANKSDLQHRIAKAVLVRGQPIATTDIEPYVMLVVARTPFSVGDSLHIDAACQTLAVRVIDPNAAVCADFELRPFGVSSVDASFVASPGELDNTIVVAPIGAGAPIPRTSVAQFVSLPVVLVAAEANKPIDPNNVVLRTFARATLTDFPTLLLDKQTLISRGPPKQNIAPGVPIGESVFKDPTPTPEAAT